MNKVSWNGTVRSVGKNCINWFGRKELGRRFVWTNYIFVQAYPAKSILSTSPWNARAKSCSL
jgi:hypothetical protein